MRKTYLAATVLLALSVTLPAQQASRRIKVGDWPELRGPNRDGISRETGLINSWKLNGENFLCASRPADDRPPSSWATACGAKPRRPWRRASGARDGARRRDWQGHLGIQGQHLSERCARSPHCLSPAVDPETGNIFILTGGAEAIALSPDGKRLWSRSFGEEYAAFTTHGGRTMSPVVDGDLVIVAAAVSNWGSAAARGHRLIALDKRNGDVIYVSNPGGRPYDTA